MVLDVLIKIKTRIYATPAAKGLRYLHCVEVLHVALRVAYKGITTCSIIRDMSLSVCFSYTKNSK